MKVKSQEDQKFWNLKFSDVMWKPAIASLALFTLLPNNVIERLEEGGECNRKKPKLCQPDLRTQY